MGMYDSIICKYPLPLPEELGELTQTQIQNATYQTKDLDESLSLFKVCEEGHLWLEKIGGYYEKGDPKAKSIIDRLGKFVQTDSTWIRQDRTCTIQFYESFRVSEDQKDELNNDYWLEYEAVFIDGKLNKISILEFSKKDNAERRTREAEFKKEWKSLNNFLNKWYIKFWYSPWRWLVRNIFRTYRRIKYHAPSDWKVERFLLPW